MSVLIPGLILVFGVVGLFGSEGVHTAKKEMAIFLETVFVFSSWVGACGDVSSSWSAHVPLGAITGIGGV